MATQAIGQPVYLGRLDHRQQEALRAAGIARWAMHEACDDAEIFVPQARVAEAIDALGVATALDG